MAKSDRDFLAELETESRRRQSSFMQHIADRLGRQTPLAEAPAHPYRGAPDFWREHALSAEENKELFIDNWKKAGGQAERLPDMAAVKQYIVSLCEEMKALRLLRQVQPEWEAMALEQALPNVQIDTWDADTSSEARLELAAAADIGLVVVDHAVSVTGSIVVTSSADKGRSVSLLPTAVIAVIPAEVLHSRIGSVTDWIESQDKSDLPAGIHFISGPSRSADIENDLTIGVHGPGVVYALIVG